MQGFYTDASMAEYSRRVALTPQRLSDGRVFQYKPKTVEKWYQLYEKGGMEALIPRTRCDKGGTRVILDEAEREIHRLRKEYPRLNATKVCEKLVQDGTLPATVSVPLSNVISSITASGEYRMHCTCTYVPGADLP